MSSENQEVAATEQAPALSGDPLNNTPKQILIGKLRFPMR